MKTAHLAAFLTLAVSASPAFGSCTKNPDAYCLIGPTIPCEQLLWDIDFDDWDAATCPYWVGSGWTSYHGTEGTDSFWEIQPWGGNVYQQVTIPSYSDSTDVVGVVKLVKNVPGTERMVVDLTTTGGTVLQTLGTIRASTASGTVLVTGETIPLAGQTVRVRFRVVPGNAPGDTLFRVTQAFARALNFP